MGNNKDWWFYYPSKQFGDFRVQCKFFVFLFLFLFVLLTSKTVFSYQRPHLEINESYQFRIAAFNSPFEVLRSFESWLPIPTSKIISSFLLVQAFQTTKGDQTPCLIVEREAQIVPSILLISMLSLSSYLI